MTVEELLEHFNNKETIGEDFKVIEMMRELSAKARKIWKLILNIMNNLR